MVILKGISCPRCGGDVRTLYDGCVQCCSCNFVFEVLTYE